MGILLAALWAERADTRRGGLSDGEQSAAGRPSDPPDRERIMTSTAADVLIETIQDWGVEVVFGLPGDGINGIMQALRKRRDEVRFIQVRHEEAAALIACGYA